MMYDKQHLMAENQDLSQNTGNYLGLGSIDLGTAGTDGLGNTVVADFGRGSHVEVVGIVTAAFTSAGSTATVQMQLVMADDDALSSNLTVIAETAAIVVTALVVGYQWKLRCVPQGITKRYLGVRFVIAGETTTAGTATAFLCADRQSNPAVT
jgi:hypothetical protein